MSVSPSSSALTTTSLPLPLVSRGKVRDVYALPDAPEYLLFVATDRISAYDVVLRNGIPDKGKILTALSLFWFKKLAHIVPNHVVDPDDACIRLPDAARTVIGEGRAMVVRRARVVKIEAIVRGYITGSAWAEYSKTGTVHGIALPPGLVESQKLPAPLFTPSTKADAGAHDENISPAQGKALLGEELYGKIEKASLALYTTAAAYALARGLILADTKFEFGLVPASSLSPPPSATTTTTTTPSSPSTPPPDGETLLLIDEALTPDSSRYWPAAAYTPGHPQASFDKQFLRDWLTEKGFRRGLEGGPEGGGVGWVMEEGVVEGTRGRYVEALERLVGE